LYISYSFLLSSFEFGLFTLSSASLVEPTELRRFTFLGLISCHMSTLANRVWH